MMNSIPEEPASQTLTELFKQLNEEHLRRTIDEPIHRAAAGFRFAPGGYPSHREFIQSMAAFVRHVYSRGLPAGLVFTEEQARAEAVALLDNQYRNATARGLGAALLDARNPMQNGLALVATRLAEATSAIQREKYIRWVTGRSLYPCNWQVKCLIVKHLLHLLEPFLPDDLLHCHPAQLAENIPDLILTHIQTNTLLQQAETNPQIFQDN